MSSMKRNHLVRAFLIIIAVMCSLTLFSACSGDVDDPESSERTEYSFTSQEQKTELSVDERKELAEAYFMKEVYSTATDHLTSGKFYKVDWTKLKYKATVKQTSDTHYDVTATLVAYDKYENQIATNDEVYGYVEMEMDGTLIDAKSYSVIAFTFD